ncbi:General amino acid permease AGP2 [Fusarium albosuccineum]|uniref:General amino acid permease AGP2 n=1 Tax=Fusarium albosuccineum TaxID=1237068 RepID=A0A8H4LFM8_9HYPO|nr:General amino acid permease AGP2 [Fusarium albosuccineum]
MNSPYPENMIFDEKKTDDQSKLDRQDTHSNGEIQLIAIGGSIGTSTFVSVGIGLARGGPGSLLIAFLFYSTILSCVYNCMAEMAVFMPVSSAFVRMAGRWVDEAFGFMAGWNFFLYQAIMIPYEITAIALVLSYWRDDIPVAAMVSACVVPYLLINILAVQVYGEAEFWLASGKVMLLMILFSFTFVTMLGGNPDRDRFGFRYWNNPGSFAEYMSTGDLGRFEAFLEPLWNTALIIVGPEYVAMVAGEAKFPRPYMKSAFKAAYWRFLAFFVGSALCASIVIPYNDPALRNVVFGSSEKAGTAAASPFVIAMSNMRVGVLPHITNALMITSIFSAGNAFTYCGSRTLYGLALEGQAPAILLKCTKSGVPIYTLGVTMLFPLLAYLNVSSGSSSVLTWLINVITSAEIIDYIVISITRIADGSVLSIIVCAYGYAVFLPVKWDVGTFFTSYAMVFLAPILYFGWKLVKRTSVIKAADADLVWEKPMIDAYEAAFEEEPVGFWTEMAQMMGFKRQKAKHHAWVKIDRAFDQDCTTAVIAGVARGATSPGVGYWAVGKLPAREPAPQLPARHSSARSCGLALTGAIFAKSRAAIREAEDALRYSAGNFYINCKTTAALIGQQSFGGGRSSGTNDKAGSSDPLRRFASPRMIKEEFFPQKAFLYPSNES